MLKFKTYAKKCKKTWVLGKSYRMLQVVPCGIILLKKRIYYLPFDFKRRRQNTIVYGPFLVQNDQPGNLFMFFQLGIHFIQEFLQVL